MRALLSVDREAVPHSDGRRRSARSRNEFFACFSIRPESQSY